MKNKVIYHLNRLKVLPQLNVTGNLKINESTFIIPVSHKIGLANLKMTELWMVNLLEALLPLSQGSFVDVGVNIGQTLLKLRSVCNEIIYYGFEPNIHCITYVEKLIKANGFLNTQVIPVGISINNSLANLHLLTQEETESRASPISGFWRREIIASTKVIPLLNVATIKKFLPLKKIGFLKIDVEGGELEVLESFHEDLEKNRPFILIEILPVYTSNNTDRLQRQEKIEHQLKELGYSIFRIEKRDGNLKKIKKIKTIGIQTSLSASDYLVVPEEKEELVMKSF